MNQPKSKIAYSAAYCTQEKQRPYSFQSLIPLGLPASTAHHITYLKPDLSSLYFTVFNTDSFAFLRLGCPGIRVAIENSFRKISAK